MTGRRMLLIMYPAKGHLNAVVDIAVYLQLNGYEVFCTGGINDHLDDEVSHYNINIINCRSIPFGLNYSDELDYYKRLKKDKKDLIYGRLTGSLFQNRQNSLRQIIEEVRPTIILLDSFLGADYLCLHQYILNFKISFAFINTMTVFRTKNMPLPHTTLLPSQLIKTRISWFKSLTIDCLYNTYENFFLFGNGTKKMIKAKLNQMCLKKQHTIVDNGRISTTFTGIKELVLSASEFDFDKSHIPKERIYIGSNLSFKLNLSVLPHVDNLSQILEKPNRKIYVSLGTAYRPNVDIVRKIVKLLLTVCAKMPESIFIFSIQTEYIHEIESIPLNAYIFDNVNQYLVLSKCDVFVTHGGLNSIKESLHFGVPMLLYPINAKYDQPGNAARVVFKKMGMLGDIKKDTAAVVRDRILLLISKECFKISIKNYNETVTAIYPVNSLLKILNVL